MLFIVILFIQMVEIFTKDVRYGYGIIALLVISSIVVLTMPKGTTKMVGRATKDLINRQLATLRRRTTAS